MQKISFILTALFLVTGLQAQEMTQTTPVTYQKHTDAKNAFTIDSPDGWNKNTELKDVALELSSPDSLANYRIIIKARKNETATAILESMEGKLGYENILDPPARKLKDQFLKQMGAQDSAVGAYSVKKNGVDINQRFWVLTKGARAYLIVETVPDDNLTDFIDIFDHLSKSIRLK